MKVLKVRSKGYVSKGGYVNVHKLQIFKKSIYKLVDLEMEWFCRDMKRWGLFLLIWYVF